jgi:hypothetical protein
MSPHSSRCCVVLALVAVLTGPVAAFDPEITPVLVGDGTVDGGRLQAFDGLWDSYQRGEPDVRRGRFREHFELHDDEMGSQWVHEQLIFRGDVSVGAAVLRLDPSTLAPVKLVQHFADHPQGIQRIQLDFDASGYTRRTTTDGIEAEDRVELPVAAYYGNSFGLAVAALPLTDGYRARLPSVFPAWDGLYWLELTVVGRAERSLSDEAGGQSVEVFLVDADWLNVNDGSIYPPGPDASGGRYEIVVDPMPGQAPVWRYISDTSDIRSSSE